MIKIDYRVAIEINKNFKQYPLIFKIKFHMNYFLKCLRQYADFSGRARRSEYWFFTLFNMIFLIAIYIIAIIGVLVGGRMMLPVVTIMMWGYCLAFLLPGLAVSVRRLHDVGKSGCFLLIGLIPLIGGLFLLVQYCTDSQPGANRWGENPK